MQALAIDFQFDGPAYHTLADSTHHMNGNVTDTSRPASTEGTQHLRPSYGFSYQVLAADLLVKQSAASLAPFSPEEARRLIQLMHPYTIPAGQAFITEADDDNSFMMLILSGEVVVEAAVADTHSMTVAVAQTGDWVGELSMLDGAPRQADCRAADHNDVISAILTRQAFIQMVDDQPKLAAKLALLLANQTTIRLRGMHHKMCRLTEIQNTFRETSF